MHLTRVYRVLALALMILGSVAMIFSSWHAGHWFWADGYAVFWFVLLAGAGIWGETRSKSPAGAWLSFFGVFAFALIYRLWLTPHPGVWLDEDFQAQFSVGFSPVWAGTTQHQPPLEMALMGMLLSLFGKTEYCLRTISILSGSAGAALMVLLCRSLSGSLAVGWILGGVYFFHWLIEHYGIEARPISLGLLSAILVLYHCREYYFGRRRIDLAFWITGVSLGFLSLSSLGFQPPFLLLSITGVSAVWPVKPWRERVLFVSQWVVAVLLFLPVQVFILRYSPQMFSHISDFRLSQFLREVRWENFKGLWSIYGRLVLPWIAITLALGWFRCRRKQNPLSPELGFAAYLLSICAVFFLSTVPFFKAQVDWNLNSYYLILSWPGLVLAFAALLGWFKRFAPLSLAGCVVIAMALDPGALEQYREARGLHADYRGAYAEVLADSQVPTAVLGACLNGPMSYCPEWLVATELYLHGRHREEGGNLDFAKPETSRGLIWQSKFFSSPEAPGAIVLLLNEEQDKFPAPDPLPARFATITAKRFFRLMSYRITLPGGDPRSLLLEFLNYLSEVSRSPKLLHGGVLPLLAMGDRYFGMGSKTEKILDEIYSGIPFGDPHSFLIRPHFIADTITLVNFLKLACNETRAGAVVGAIAGASLAAGDPLASAIGGLVPAFGRRLPGTETEAFEIRDSAYTPQNYRAKDQITPIRLYVADVYRSGRALGILNRLDPSRDKNVSRAAGNWGLPKATSRALLAREYQAFQKGKATPVMGVFDSCRELHEVFTPLYQASGPFLEKTARSLSRLAGQAISPDEAQHFLEAMRQTGVEGFN